MALFGERLAFIARQSWSLQTKYDELARMLRAMVETRAGMRLIPNNQSHWKMTKVISVANGSLLVQCDYVVGKPLPVRGVCTMPVPVHREGLPCWCFVPATVQSGETFPYNGCQLFVVCSLQEKHDDRGGQLFLAGLPSLLEIDVQPTAMAANL